MKSSACFSILSLAAALLAGCAPAPAPGPSPEAMIAAAEQVDQAFLDGFKNRDAAAIAALYWNDEETHLFPPDAMEARGVAAIEEYWTEAFAHIPADATLEVPHAHHAVVGDGVVTWGMYRMTIPVEGGEPTVSQGRFTNVKAERDGKWVYIVDHASVPMPPPAED